MASLMNMRFSAACAVLVFKPTNKHDFLGRWGDEVLGHGRTGMTSDLEIFSRRERFVDCLVPLLARKH
ncbi:hypothetical protein GW17_00049315 [Ensete ventricosum]|nr:hypothetical protein GW17_00049315 [Ensete ventricosum]